MFPSNTIYLRLTQFGSAKPLDKPALPGTGFKVLGGEGYDDGGVADLSLLIDLEDSVQRRRRGENEYFQALKADLLPRATKGPMAKMSRREQKVSLAQLLFSEDDDCEDKGPSEVYVDQVDGEEDASTLKHRADRLAQARAALRLSLLLREPACTSLSLSELCKRKLTHSGKEGAEEALRCSEKALQIAGEGFWDGDEIAIEVCDDTLCLNVSVSCESGLYIYLLIMYNSAYLYSNLTHIIRSPDHCFDW